MKRYPQLGNSIALPRVIDFFPTTKRGHGSAHQAMRPDSDTGDVWETKHSLCVDPTCVKVSPKSKNAHQDKAANRKEWEDAVGIDQAW